MEQKTPARGNAFWRNRSGADNAPIPSTGSIAQDHVPQSQKNQLARDLAARAAAILPEGFENVLPRGYTVAGAFLVMARFEMEGTRGHALYGRHTHWGDKETGVFLRDLQEGWLTELGAYMRWQLRMDPVANATFQHALVHLHQEVSERLKELE